MEASEYINGKEYWVLSFQSTKKIRNTTRDFTNIKGKIWIDPATYCISKESYSLDFEDISHMSGSNFYSQVEGNNIITKVIISQEFKKNMYFVKAVLDFYIPQFREKY